MSRSLQLLVVVSAFLAVLTLCSCAGNNRSPDAATCNRRLRDEISADVSRAVGVVLSSHRDTVAYSASVAARSQVTKAKVARGEGLVNPVALAVEQAILTEFRHMAPRVKEIIKVFIQTGLKRLCTLQDCCFEN